MAFRFGMLAPKGNKDVLPAISAVLEVQPWPQGLWQWEEMLPPGEGTLTPMKVSGHSDVGTNHFYFWTLQNHL